MPDSNGFDIPITSSFSSTGTDAAAAGVQRVAQSGEQVEGKFKEASHAADEFLDKLKAGVGIDVGHRLVEGLEEVIGKFREAIAEGVAYDKEMETLGIGLAAALKQAQPEAFGDFNTALQASGQLLDVVKAKALELNVSTTGLAHTLQVSMLGLIEGGITDLNKQVETTGLLMQAAAAKGVSGFQQVRDIIDILNGKAERVVLAKELGISNEDIKQAKEAGQLAEYLTSKLGAYRDAAKATGESLAGLEQRFENLTDALKGEVATPVFDALKVGLKELDDSLADPAVADGLRSIGFEVAGLVRTGAGLLNFAVQNAGALRLLAEGTAAWGAAVAAVKIKDLVVGLGAKVLGLRASTAATARETVATAEDTVATETNTRAKLANAEASRTQATASESAAVGKAGGAGGLGIAGALNAGILAGTALAAIITEIAAHIDATTAKENEFGAAVERANKALIQQVREATTPAEQVAARAKAQQELVDASIKLANASEQERQGYEAKARTARLLLEHFNEQAGIQASIEQATKAVTAEEAKQQQLQDLIAAREKEIQGFREQALQQFGGNREAAEASVRQIMGDQLYSLNYLKLALAAQEQLVAAAREHAAAQGGVTTALKEAGVELDRQQLADSSKAQQAQAYASALDEVVRRIAQDTGLREDVVRGIRSANDAERAGISLSQQKQNVLAGYIKSLIDARNASDKATDAATKEQATINKKYDDAKGSLDDINHRLEDQKDKLKKVVEGNQDVATKARETKDVQFQIDTLYAQQKEKLAEIVKLEQQRKEAAHPKETADRDAAQNALDNDPLDPKRDYTDQELQDRADRRAALLAQRNRANQVIQGQVPANSSAFAPQDDQDELARDRVDTAAANQQAADTGLFRSGVNTQGGLPGVVRADGSIAEFTAAVNRLAEALERSGTVPGAGGGPLGLGTGAATQGPLPGAVDPAGTGPVSDFTKGAGDLGTATANAADASGKLAEAAGKLPASIDGVKTGFDGYHNAFTSGLTQLTQGIATNMDGLTAALSGQNQVIEDQGRAIRQLQLQVSNLANNP